MGRVHICFDVFVHLSLEQSFEKIEKQYYQFYKKLIAFLYKHPHFSISLYFPGVILEWLERFHPEFISLFSELINKKQIEILGGGYYDPIFPLILPIDRVGQIEYLTTTLRKTFGKRPRGIKVPHSIFNTSIIQNLNNCGIDYVLLQSQILKSYNKKTNNLFPVLLEESGKTIIAVPARQEEKPELSMTPESYLQRLLEIADETDEDMIFSCSFSLKEFFEFLSHNWFDKFYTLVETSQELQFSTITSYLKNYPNIQKGFLSSDCPQELLQWAVKPYQNVKLKDSLNYKCFLHTYPEIANIYARMNITQNLIQLGKGDKARKKAAQEELWQAQNSFAFFYDGTDGIGKNAIRQCAYKHLLLSEKFIKDIGIISEYCVSSDMNFDGYKEYLFASEFYNALVTSKQGSITEFDVLHNFKNYSDTSGRNDFLDKISDTYEKKIFVDHLVENDDFDKFIHNQNAVISTFADKIYREVTFDRKRRQIQLYCQSYFGVLQQEVAIRKNYTFAPNGILVQYILCNKSSFPIKAKFVIESNFCFTDCNQENLKIEVIADDTRELPCPNQLYIRQDSVSHLQLTDSNAKVTFDIEPNEQGGVFIQPLYINRIISEGLEKQFQASTTCFYWDVEIAPGLELEKNLFLTVNTPVKKLKQKD